MKFLSLALTALLSLAEAKKSISGKQLKARMEKGQVNKHTLMKNAKPYNAAARKLEDQEWQINGMYSVQFNSCFSMTVSDEDLFDENIINYASQGDVVAEKSYILFSVCYTSECYYQAENEKMTFITDIPSFFQAFADFLPNQVENYCEGCQQNYDYCSGQLAYEYEQQAYEEQQQAAEEEAANEDGAAEEEAAEEGGAEGEEGAEEGAEEGGERRKLSSVMDITSRKLANNREIKMIDCDTCNAYECFEAEQEGQNQQQQGDDVVYEFEDALNWLDGLSQCQQMENVYFDNMAVYGGLICNADGNGVEIGVFFDADCQVYAPKVSYASLMTYADSQYFTMSEEVVEYMFTNDFSCYQPEVVYTNPYQYEEDAQQDENAQEEENQAPEAAEWCQALFNGQMEATNMYDCGVDANAEQQQAEEEQYDQNLYYYEWYSYQITDEQADDASEVCQAVKSMNGQVSTVYDKKNGGTLYNYKKQWNSNGGNNGMGSGAIVSLVILLVVVAGAVGAFVFNKKDSDKKEPLINNADGTMA